MANADLLGKYQPQPSAQYGVQIASWLLLCCVLILAMIVLGGITRLTGSGLSMVEWGPITGTVPPLNESQWEATFRNYQQYPEYQKVNRSMTLAEFKSIFWVEYAHRLLGRTIGLVFFVPFIYFLVRRRIGWALAPKLVTMFILGALQGLLGWFMVKSGLIDEPRVSAYRLTAHLALAAIIYGYVLWVALGLLFPKAENDYQHVKSTRRFSFVVTGVIGIMIISGGFVAGTRAGFAFNTFPLMNGMLIPDGILAMKPVWPNFFENIATVQFDHRLIAYSLCILIPAFCYYVHRTGVVTRTRVATYVLLITLVVQVSLGIATLLLIVPAGLSATHQAGAFALLTVSLFINHELRGRS
ncbi:MAG: COX15/CtaA family protein [Gammaproteobacteria bacterium]|nr:COX15/CtaA family protein [Pseudomonadota bacterium]MCZ6732666.1 COX15/CtaA family protein [Gammaproteobacteria bacterium]